MNDRPETATTIDLGKFFDQSLDLLCIADTDGFFRKLNPRWEMVLGYRAGELEGQRFLDLVHPDDLPETLAALGELAAAQNIINFANRCRHRDGSYRWLEWCSRSEGAFIYATAREMTGRKEAEARLEESEKRFRILFDTMLEGFAFHEAICNEDGEVTDYRYLDINPAFEQLTGLKRETTIGRTVREVLPEIEEEWIRCYGRVALTGIPDERESYVKELDRYYRARAYSPEKGKFAVVFEETTDRKRAERELLRREALYNNLVETATDLVWRCDNEGRYIFLNPAWERVFGYAMDEMLGHRFTEFMHPGQAEQDGVLFAHLLATNGRVSGHETIHLRKDGTPVHLVFNAAYYHDATGQALGTQGTAHDITRRKMMEVELQKSQMITENIPIGLFLYHLEDLSDDRTLRMVYANPAVKTLIGLGPEDIIGKTLDENFPGLRAQGIPLRYAEVIRSQTAITFEDIIYGDERMVAASFSVKAFPLPGNCLGVAFENITERKRAEEERLCLEKQLLHAQKLESLGVLAGGIAHDFNNLLMAIMGNADLALMQLSKESPAVDNLRKIELASARAADLARQMLAYSGKGRFVVENLDLNKLVEEMWHMLEVSISKKALLRFNPYHSLPSVEADPTQLRQIIMNLVINASEAIGEKSGVIAVTTGCLECSKAYLQSAWLTDSIPEGLYVSLEIADTGCGMSKETIEKIFDPFFTTKFTGRGLGMAAVLGIVRGHKGAIKVYSELNRGTTFKILLPASSRPAELFNAEKINDDWHGSGTVLLVDDEETVRGIGAEMLKKLGFGVVTANDGREALDRYREHPGIAFIILDLTMPHMDGEQCFRELRQIDPNVKVIMSSGFSEQEVTQKFAGKGLAGFIQKPYKLSVLRDEIRKATAGP